jgi:hypothetical protein
MQYNTRSESCYLKGANGLRCSFHKSVEQSDEGAPRLVLGCLATLGLGPTHTYRDTVDLINYTSHAHIAGSNIVTQLDQQCPSCLTCSYIE